MLTDSEVDHIAILARLRLSKEEHSRFKADLSSILGYIDQLNQVNTADVEPLYQTAGLLNAFRIDEPKSIFPPSPSLNEKLTGSPAGYVKTRSVLAKK